MQHNSQNKVCFAVSLYQIHGLQWTDIHKSTEPANVIPLCPHMHMYQDRHKTAKCIMGFKQAVSPLYPHQDPIRPSKFRTKAPAPVMSRPGMVPPTSSAKPSTCSLISLRENHDHIFFCDFAIKWFPADSLSIQAREPSHHAFSTHWTNMAYQWHTEMCVFPMQNIQFWGVKNFESTPNGVLHLFMISLSVQRAEFSLPIS